MDEYIKRLTAKLPTHDTPDFVTYFKRLPWLLGVDIRIKVTYVTDPSGSRLLVTPTHNGYDVVINTVWGVADMRYSAALAVVVIIDGSESQGVEITPYDTVMSERGIGYYCDYVMALMMPEHQLRHFVKPTTTLDDVVDHFQVEPRDAKARLGKLGLYTPAMTRTKPQRRLLMIVGLSSILWNIMVIVSTYYPDRPITLQDVLRLGAITLTALTWWLILRWRASNR